MLLLFVLLWVGLIGCVYVFEGFCYGACRYCLFIVTLMFMFTLYVSLTEWLCFACRVILLWMCVGWCFWLFYFGLLFFWVWPCLVRILYLCVCVLLCWFGLSLGLQNSCGILRLLCWFMVCWLVLGFLCCFSDLLFKGLMMIILVAATCV